MAVYHVFNEAPVDAAELRAKLRGLESEFTPIGINKPLTVQIRHVYTGRHPKKNVFGKRKDMLITSAMKDVTVFNASARAVNFLRADVGANSNFNTPAATEQGTPLISYSPAVTTSSTILTIEVVFDQFPDELFGKVSSVLAGLAGIPAFLPAAGYLMAASSVAKVAGDLGHALFDGRPVLQWSETIDFDVPGTTDAEADFRILCDPGFDPGAFKFDPKRGLVDRQTNVPYRGDEPYVVLSLDGKKRDELAAFAPTAASAMLLQRFLDVQDGGEAVLDALTDAMKLYSDSRYRMQADTVAKRLEKAEKNSLEFADLNAKYHALIANIQTESMKPAAVLAAGGEG